ncbi:hypothetical protein GJ496_009750 [Pomphorhynchus laevis]|nr:hypothetical protein GJ496_009750 [Pomphorhynchus laevis]
MHLQQRKLNAISGDPDALDVWRQWFHTFEWLMQYLNAYDNDKLRILYNFVFVSLFKPLQPAQNYEFLATTRLLGDDSVDTNNPSLSMDIILSDHSANTTTAVSISKL